MFSGLDWLNFPATTISEPENRNGNWIAVSSSTLPTGNTNCTCAKAGEAISLRNPVSSSAALAPSAILLAIPKLVRARSCRNLKSALNPKEIQFTEIPVPIVASMACSMITLVLVIAPSVGSPSVNNTSNFA